MNRSRWQQHVTIRDSGKSRFSRYCVVHLCRQQLISHHQKAEPFSTPPSRRLLYDAAGQCDPMPTVSPVYASRSYTFRVVWRCRPMRSKCLPFPPCMHLVRTHFVLHDAAGQCDPSAYRFPRVCISFVHISWDTLHCKSPRPFCLHGTKQTTETRTSTPRVGYEPTVSVSQRRKALTATVFGRQSSVHILACTLLSLQNF
jgi:hypothetical protein